MSSYRVLIDQRAILCPYQDLREYSDTTPPLSYSVNVGGPYYYQLLEQPLFVSAGEGAVPYHRDTQLSSVGYASVRDFKLCLNLSDDAHAGGVATEGMFVFEVFYGDVDDVLSYVYVFSRRFRCMPGKNVEIDLPDIERVAVPADMNMYWRFYPQSGFEWPDIQGFLTVHYLCCLDDK